MPEEESAPSGPHVDSAPPPHRAGRPSAVLSRPPPGHVASPLLLAQGLKPRPRSHFRCFHDGLSEQKGKNKPIPKGGVPPQDGSSRGNELGHRDLRGAVPHAHGTPRLTTAPWGAGAGSAAAPGPADREGRRVARLPSALLPGPDSQGNFLQKLELKRLLPETRGQKTRC